MKYLKDTIKFIIFIGIGIFFIYWFLLKLDPEQKQAIWSSFLDANYWWVTVAMICCLASHLVRALRWQLLFTPLGYKPTLLHTCGAVVVTYMANLAFPRLGEVMRCALLRNSDDIPMEKSLGTVVTERLIDLLIFGLIALVGVIALFSTLKDWVYEGLQQKFESLPSAGMIAGFLIAAVIIALLAYKLWWKKLLRISFFKKIDEMIRGCIDGIISIFHLGRKNNILFILYSLTIYFLYILGGLIIFRAFGETWSLGFEAAFMLYLFGSVGMSFSQGGIGVYPVLVQMSLAIYGISMEVGTACGWLLWGSQQAITIIIGMIFLIYFSFIKKKKAITE